MDSHHTYATTDRGRQPHDCRLGSTGTVDKDRAVPLSYLSFFFIVVVVVVVVVVYRIALYVHRP